MEKAVICFVILICFLSHIPAEENVSIETLLSAVEKIVKYYASNYQSMNLDGIFGLRLLEGQLEMMLEQVAADLSGGVAVGSHLPQWDLVLHRISRLHTDSLAISKAALSSLQASEPLYYKKLHALVEKPFRYAKEYKRVNPVLVWRSTTNEELSEETCDACMSEILVTGAVQCSLSTPCLNILLKHRLSHYGLTHQILYTVVAEMYGCGSVVNNYLREQGLANSIGHYQEILCSNNFHQVVQMIVHVQGRIVPGMQDLFMEQQFVCPMLGYMEFLHNHWLQQILSWQSSLGCYGSMSSASLSKNRLGILDNHKDVQKEKPRPDLAKFAAAVQQSQDRLVMYDINGKAYSTNVTQVKLESLGGARIPDNRLVPADNKMRPMIPGRLTNEVQPNSHKEAFRRLGGPQRRLLMERSLDDGCLAHKTATALGALSQYLRFIVFPGPSSYKLSVNLQSVNHLMNAAFKSNTSRTKDDVRQSQNTNVGTENQIVEARQDIRRLVKVSDSVQQQPEKREERVEERVVEESVEDTDYYNNGEIELEAASNEGRMEVKDELNPRAADPKGHDMNLQPGEQNLEELNQRPWEQNLRPGEQNLRPGEQNLRPGEQNLRPGEQNLRPGEQNLRPVEQNLRPGEQNLRPGEQNLRPVEPMSADETQGPTRYINDPWPAINDQALDDRHKIGDEPLEDGYYDDQKGHPYLEIEADLSSEVSLVKGEWDGNEGLVVGRLYLVVMAAMVVVLYVMWLFIRKRRVLIRYRHR